MKPVKASVIKSLCQGSRLVCADNTGAKIVEIVSVKGYKGVKRRKPKCGVGSVIKATVKEGDVKLRKTLVDAVIVRQREEYRRRSGLRVSFEDNACILITEKAEGRGTQVKGPVAKEVIERFQSIGKICSIVV
jgi:large subunit ribosomal protein L14